MFPIYMSVSELDDWLGRDEFEHSFLMYVTTDPTIRMVGLFNNVDLVAIMAYKHIFCHMLTEIVLVAKKKRYD